jgi:peptidoglycan/LPS O-acetylase OafA/YrhL
MMLYIIFFLTARKKIKIFYSTTLLILFSIFLFYFNKLIGYGFFCFFIGGFTFLIFEKINNYKTKKINFIIFFLLISIIIIFFIKLYKVTDIQFKILILTIFFPSLIIALVFIQKVYKKLGEKISLIGDISYSVYLIHLTIQISLFLILKFNNIKLNFNSNLIFISYITIITVISFLSYKYFEKPSQSFLRKKIKN